MRHLKRGPAWIRVHSNLASYFLYRELFSTDWNASSQDIFDLSWLPRMMTSGRMTLYRCTAADMCVSILSERHIEVCQGYRKMHIQANPGPHPHLGCGCGGSLYKSTKSGNPNIYSAAREGFATEQVQSGVRKLNNRNVMNSQDTISEQKHCLGHSRGHRRKRWEE